MLGGRNVESSREVALVINVRSHQGPSTARIAQRELERQGVRVRETHLVRDGPGLSEAVHGAISRGAAIVAVGGGDGTVSAVVDLLANKPELTLGLLPIGTGNEVAKVLGIPLELVDACRVVASGRVMTVDLVRANGNYFVHTALVGYPAHVNHAVPEWLKHRLGKVAYTYSLLASLVGAKPFRASVTTGSARWEGNTVILVVGNGQFHVPGSSLTPHDEVAKRGILVFTPRDSHWYTLIRLAIGLWITRRRQPSLLISTAVDSATVTADPPQEVDLDGEFGQLTPVDFQLASEALRILVPNAIG